MAKLPRWMKQQKLEYNAKKKTMDLPLRIAWWYIPIYLRIIWYLRSKSKKRQREYEINARVLAASKKLGNPLDNIYEE